MFEGNLLVYNLTEIILACGIIWGIMGPYSNCLTNHIQYFLYLSIGLAGKATVVNGFSSKVQAWYL